MRRKERKEREAYEITRRRLAHEKWDREREERNQKSEDDQGESE